MASAGTARAPAVFIAPLVAVMLIGFVWPLAQTFVGSFHPNTPQGVDATHWTLMNYRRLADPFYGEVLLRLTDNLDVRAGRDGPHHACAKCAADLGPTRESYKDHCLIERHLRPAQ